MPNAPRFIARTALIVVATLSAALSPAASAQSIGLPSPWKAGGSKKYTLTIESRVEDLDRSSVHVVKWSITMRATSPDKELIILSWSFEPAKVTAEGMGFVCDIPHLQPAKPARSG